MNEHRQREALNQRSDGVRHVGIVIGRGMEVESGDTAKSRPVDLLTETRNREMAARGGLEASDDYLIAATEVADRLAARGR